MGAIDNVYVINYLINRQLGKGKGVTALFVDLKAAFDSIDRRVLVESMEERGIRRSLVERVKKVLRQKVESGQGKECGRVSGRGEG